MIDNLIFHNDVFFVIERNCLYVEHWLEQWRKNTALPIAPCYGSTRSWSSLGQWGL